ncbi:MAG: oligosaccharide flippase family protein [Candidatus Marinimicrobia bacterium]|nr:oligosaccharide flippase family protein [Candidatus Neomarinimicrobiota bacterium]
MVRQDIIRLSKQTLIYGFGYVIARMINFLLLPFYSHHILPSEYGVISLIYAFIAFLNIIYHYGLESAFLRFYSRSGSDEGHSKKEVFTTVFLSIIVTSFLFSALIWIFSPSLSVFLLKSVEYTRIIRMTAVILLLDALFLIPLALSSHTKQSVGLYIHYPDKCPDQCRSQYLSDTLPRNGN